LRRCWLLLLCAAAPVAHAQTVDVATLLRQMTDLNWLTSRPSPYFKAAQSSSYDRASTDPKDAKTWFANGDLGKYVRVEEKNGHKEYVMADLTGPGAVVRVWSANPMGTIRFYFDGEATPRLEAKMADLLTGKVAGFPDPIAYGSAQGTNIYFPFPYQKSLKITVENDKSEWPSLYYHVGYRTYVKGAQVETYDPARLPTGQIKETLSKLSHPTTVAAKKSEATKWMPSRPGGSYQRTLTSKSGGVLQMLQVKIPFPLIQTFKAMDWKDPYQPHNVLRNTRLRISCDGERTVDVPLGDFFGTAPGINPGQSLPASVTKDGTMTAYWPMPFLKKMDISIIPPKDVKVPLLVNIAWSDQKFTPETYYFRAQWNIDFGSTRPMRDMEFLKASGEGLYVGTHLHVTNPTPAWWGEGDEKVYVDDEAFPSTFGTGTEDYFGYAWCSPMLFTKPYHGQARCDGPGNFGQTSVRRYQTFDPIPFTTSLRFDIEMWHWAEVDARYARTTYWYARPGSSSAVKPIADKDLVLIETAPAAPVKGAIEGESLRRTMTGGTAEEQGGFFELSDGKQIWWMDAKEGEKLTLQVPVKDAGRYQVTGCFCHARDYGIHILQFLDAQNKPLGEPIKLDFFGDGVKWKKIVLGTLELPKGTAQLVVTSQGHRANAVPRNMFGLDYLLLERK